MNDLLGMLLIGSVAALFAMSIVYFIEKHNYPTIRKIYIFLSAAFFAAFIFYGISNEPVKCATETNREMGE